MMQFNGKNGKRAKVIIAVVVILIVAAMLISTIIGALASVL